MGEKREITKPEASEELPSRWLCGEISTHNEES
jgi:hypothetical protein